MAMTAPTLDEIAASENARIIYWVRHYREASPEIRKLLNDLITCQCIEQVGPTSAEELLLRVSEKMREVEL